ncbi:MAG: hypothetical protein WCE44_02520 [Candidatus Velthaea sp.]
MKAPRARGNERETIVADLFSWAGRYAVTLRGSGSKGTKQQEAPNRVAGDVVVLPRCGLYAPGIQIAVGGQGKSAPRELADLREGSVPGYACACVIFGGRGESMKPVRWLLDDGNGETYTACAGLHDLLDTIKARAGTRRSSCAISWRPPS